MNIAYYTQLQKVWRKLSFYILGFVSYTIPNSLLRWRAQYLLNSLSCDERMLLEGRVSYYCRLPYGASVPEVAIRVGDYKYPWHSHHKYVTYFFDLYSTIRCFDKSLQFVRQFGDVNREQAVPTFVKSRPITDKESMCTLLKLNRVRHFRFLNSDMPFSHKRNQMVFRNLVFVHQPQRTLFLERFFGHPMVDAGLVNADTDTGRTEWLRPFMPISEQLKYKFVACIEGNDVATNLKWVMSSNSIAVMPRPRFETWFMEGTLKPDYHYIEVADDYHDLEDRLRYYIDTPEAAETIVKNAHEYIRKFQNDRLERAAQLLTARRYFELTGQIPQSEVYNIPTI